ncbi:N-acetylglucosamine kinase [Rhizocola hellebori]|uniref:N-acetylglucosamine kinase n=1 Tax=Rhizocola hellebori TaxID=1392758 RepID=A0A8J3QG56_9ACTN|nr:BadF/BadG/BcrA/BcrD ATPase family protein [Rhizocola hellebori]GIH08676.1 N-acetylglucosamine kinase [Rhizocola hellebori]
MLVLGIDVGGTASRALVTTLDGTRVGFGRAGAANPVSVPIPKAVAQLRAACAAALSEVDSSRIVSVVIGMAGSSRLADPAVAAAFDLGLPVEPHIVGDVVVAFAAGSTSLDGTVLISGTGAVAARIANGAQTEVADGLGWLLGDLGSGFWLGREAAALTARALYAAPSHGLLVESVAQAVGNTDPDEFVIAVQSRPPHDLARLAPLVLDAARHGDPAAVALTQAAAGHLCAAAEQVHRGGPIVLSGSVLRHFDMVRESVSRRLATRFPQTQIVLAEPGEVGAARLAARLSIAGP